MTECEVCGWRCMECGESFADDANPRDRRDSHCDVCHKCYTHTCPCCKTCGYEPEACRIHGHAGQGEE